MEQIQKNIKKVFLYRPSMKLAAVGAAVLLALLLIPLFRLIPYAAPWYDDYNYGIFAKNAMLETPGLMGALKGAWECARTQWYAWQGTYSSIFFMALMPGIWGEDKYFLGPLFLLILLTVSVLTLVGVLMKDVLKADTASCVIIQCVTASVVIVLLYSSNAGIFWYNAGIHYVGMHAVGMLLVASQVHLLRTPKKGLAAGLAVLGMAGALLAAGSNFVTALQGILTLLTVAALGLLFYRKKVLLLLPALCVYAFGFYKNIAAPGNSVRARSYEGWGYSPVMSVFRSFLEAFKHLGEFTGWITLAVLILLVPIIWRTVQKCEFSFRLPGLVTAWSFCLYAAGFTPSLYSLGHAGLGRTLNAVKITYQLLLILNTVYWVGWVNCRRRQRRTQIPEAKGQSAAGQEKTAESGGPQAVETSRTGPAPWWFYACMGAVMLVIFSFSKNQAGNYSSYGAYYYVHTGEAYNFHREYLQRVELLKSSEKHVVLEPYHFKPWLLCTQDLTDNPNEEPNRAIAAWYGKESVVAAPKEQNGTE